ncbi:MAG: cellulase family glycosylhydrolase, partial [Dehalococcoidia bacterium]|nr:cellulase family glycosylhydrolase [Dehalococcoidia bacterium]
MRWSRVVWLRWLSVAVAGLAVVGALVVPNPFTVTSTVSAPLKTIPHTDVNPFGATFFLEREVEAWKREQTVKMARDAGIGWAKVMISWQEVEPRRGRFYDDRYRKSTWDKFDDIVALLERYGIRPIVRLDKPPDWALARGADPGNANTPLVSVAEFANYAREVATRYRGRVQHYQIWNEPNLAAEWGGRRPDPVAYTVLLRAAATAIREADPDAIILSAPLAQTLERSERAMPETEFLDSMYQAGAAPWFDILAANAYGFDRPPTDPPSPDTLNFQRVVLLREKMVERGDRNKPVWLNEFGWNAAPASFPTSKLIWGRVSEEKQAEYTAEAIKLARSWDWMGVITIWYFRQVGDIPADRADYYFRMVDVDFTKRLVYHAVQKLAHAQHVAAPGVHQVTSPAVETRGQWRHRRANDHGVIQSVTAGDTLWFQFHGSSVALITQRGPGGGVAQVKLDGADLPHLPHAWGGRAIPDFRAPTTVTETTPIATNLRPGVHTLQVTVLDGRQTGVV